MSSYMKQCRWKFPLSQFFLLGKRSYTGRSLESKVPQNTQNIPDKFSYILHIEFNIQHNFYLICLYIERKNISFRRISSKEEKQLR